MINDKLNIYSKKQLLNIYSYAEDIIQTMPPKALDELLGGYENDVDAILSEMINQTADVMNFSVGLQSEDLHYLESLEAHMDERLKKLSYNYFKTTVLGDTFDQGWRNLEWGNLAQIYPWSTFLCARESGKCFSADTKVVMYDGSLKKIQDVIVGDRVMGPDSKPRNVLKLHSGVDDMYEIEQKMFKNYTVNSRHDMYFKRWRKVKNEKGRWRNSYDAEDAKVVVMEAKDLAEQKPGYFHDSFGVGSKGWDLPESKLLIDPYFLGVWLGDGDSHTTKIASIDHEVIDFIYQYAESLDLKVSHPEESIVYQILAPGWIKNVAGVNMLLNRFNKYSLINNKHIPDVYMRSSRAQRLELLAGLIDSDGHNPKDKKSTIIFTQKSFEFARQVQNLCWSLGFRCNIGEYTYKTKQTKSGVAKTCQVHISGNVHSVPCKIKRKISKIEVTSKSPQRRGLGISHVGKGKYFGFTCDKDHLFLLEDSTIVKNSFEFSFAFPIWRLYSYDKPMSGVKDSRDNRNRKETCIISNEKSLVRKHFAKINQEILSNDILAEKLNPGRKAFPADSIVTETGSSLWMKSYGSAIRGLHVGATVVDDFLDSSSMWSSEQRLKFNEIFFSEILNIVNEGGYLLVSGTPFHEQDLYYDLKQSKEFQVFEYPAIMPNGTVLAPDRFSIDQLRKKKGTLSPIQYAREILITPLADGSTIFPMDTLMNSTIGMENISLINSSDNIDSFPVKFARIVVGCDFAVSSKIGADYTVYTVWGACPQGNFYLLHVFRKRGVGYNEQLQQILSINRRFKPNSIVCENNGFQSYMSEGLRAQGLQGIVKPFTTTAQNKKDLYLGLPSLATLFERGEIKIPFKDGTSRDTANQLFGEFNSITFNSDNGKLESTAGHDDGPMSSFMAVQDLRENTSKYKFYYA